MNSYQTESAKHVKVSNSKIKNYVRNHIYTRNKTGKIGIENPKQAFESKRGQKQTAQELCDIATRLII